MNFDEFSKQVSVFKVMQLQIFCASGELSEELLKWTVISFHLPNLDTEPVLWGID